MQAKKHFRSKICPLGGAWPESLSQDDSGRRQMVSSQGQAPSIS
jgi:hypothetical protein